MKNLAFLFLCMILCLGVPGQPYTLDFKNDTVTQYSREIHGSLHQIKVKGDSIFEYSQVSTRIALVSAGRVRKINDEIIIFDSDRDLTLSFIEKNRKLSRFFIYVKYLNQLECRISGNHLIEPYISIKKKKYLRGLEQEIFSQFIPDSLLLRKSIDPIEIPRKFWKTFSGDDYVSIPLNGVVTNIEESDSGFTIYILHGHTRSKITNLLSTSLREGDYVEKGSRVGIIKSDTIFFINWYCI